MTCAQSLYELSATINESSSTNSLSDLKMARFSYQIPPCTRWQMHPSSNSHHHPLRHLVTHTHTAHMLHQLLLAALAGASVVPYEPHEHSSIRDASFRSGLHFETISLYDIGGGGWHWLNLGEGAVTFGNTSLPHRPAAFPDWLDEGLPVRGVLVPFVDLAETKVVDGGEEGSEAEGEQGHATGDEAEKEGVEAPERACVPVFRPRNPPRTDRLALVERGGCDFATKVLAAQARGAGAVIVGDSARPHESDREGRTRENLITMFSPGECFEGVEECRATRLGRNG